MGFDFLLIFFVKSKLYFSRYKLPFLEILTSSTLLDEYLPFLKPPADKIAFVADTDRVLGLRLTQGPIGGGDGGSIDDAKMQKLIATRNQARADKNFAIADTIRDALDAVGVKLKDSPDGTKWEN